MVRKSSDMVMLLGSRGRSRSRSALGKGLSKWIDSVLGRARWREDRKKRTTSVPGWIALAAVLVAFGGGFLAGGTFGTGKPGEAQLSAGDGAREEGRTGQVPGFVNDVAPQVLASRAFIVASYQNLADQEARTRAEALARQLQANRLTKSRPYAFKPKDPRHGERVWTVAVYFDGAVEQKATRDALLALPGDLGDANFAQKRINDAEKWPIDYEIQ